MRTLLIVFVALWPALAAAQQPSPSYYRQIRPFFARYCVRCHNEDEPKGGLALEDFEALALGGNSGEVVVPGEPDESLLVLLVEKKKKPHMPPPEARQPSADEIRLLREWVQAGAHDDTDQAKGELVIPKIEPKKTSLPPVSDVVLSGDGTLMALAAGEHVLLLEPKKLRLWGRIGPLPAPVTAVALSADRRWLAAAFGTPTVEGKIALYALPSHPLYEPLKPRHVLLAHHDLIYDLAFAPNRPHTLASAGYDKLVRLWDPASGQKVADLKDHSDAVYGVAWSPDGKYLATASADRALKIWHVSSRKRLYSLTESTDWLYTVAWHPKKNWVAAAGVDRSIRLWEVRADGGRVVRSTFAHEGPVTALAFTPDGRHLVSVGEDGVLKLWDADRLTERAAYADLSDQPYALVVDAAQQRAYVGLYGGQLLAVPLTKRAKVAAMSVQSWLVAALPAPPAPKIQSLEPLVLVRGATASLAVRGQNLRWVSKARLEGVAAEAKTLRVDTHGTLQLAFDLPSQLRGGRYRLVLESKGGRAETELLIVEYPLLEEQEPNDSRSRATPVEVNRSVRGRLSTRGEVDFFAVQLEAGEELGLVVRTVPEADNLQPVLLVHDPSGQVIARSHNGFAGIRVRQAGRYTIEIRDVEFRGSGKGWYVVSLGKLPIVTEVFPLGIAAGQSGSVRVRGVHLGQAVQSISLKAAADAAGKRQPLPLSPRPLNPPAVIVGRFRSLVETSDTTSARRLQLPGAPVTVDGRIEVPGDVDYYEFRARAGEQLVLEVAASELGSRLDSFIEVLDASLRPIERAVLRCEAQTYTTLNVRDARQTGFRIDSWAEFTTNDYVYADGEVLRIKRLPRNPDDDVQFFAYAGQRVAYFDTTPSYKPVGSMVYKVSIHPPGATLTPNGMPLFRLYYRNDDAGPPYVTDSRLHFTAPADGTFVVAVRDSRGEGGEGYAYRLTLRRPEPGFRITIAPRQPRAWRGGSVPISISCRRDDGFMGPVVVRFSGLAPGYTLPETTVLAETYDASVPLYAAPDATAPPADAADIEVTATAVIGNKQVVQKLRLKQPQLQEPGDLTAAVDRTELTLAPGEIGRFKVSIQRHHGFKGRVPIEVRGLPHGVRVLDVGLNGILITERETERWVRVYVEPWVKPQDRWFGVYARREGKNTLHGAAPLRLRIRSGRLARQ